VIWLMCFVVEEKECYIWHSRRF